MDDGLLEPGATLVAQVYPDVLATVTAEGHLLVDGTAYPAPSAAARAVTDEPVNGWTSWLADTGDWQMSLQALRQQLSEESDG